MTVQTKYEPREAVWYFKDSVPTQTEIKAIHIKIDKTPRTNTIIKYELLREKTHIHEGYLFSTQQELYSSVQCLSHMWFKWCPS